MKKKILGLALAVVGCELAGGLGSLFTRPAINAWYAGLNKGPLNPPNWVFGPVWTTLFALMGVAAYLVWEKRKSTAAPKALMIFAVQLGLNIGWSAIFFGLRKPGAGLLEMIVLWVAILWTLSYFWKISKPAGALIVPYLLWVSFAAYLNYSIAILN